MIDNEEVFKLLVRVYQKDKPPVSMSFDVDNSFCLIKNYAGEEIATFAVSLNNDKFITCSIKSEELDIEVLKDDAFKMLYADRWIDVNRDFSGFALLNDKNNVYLIEIEIGSEDEVRRRLDVLEPCEEFMEGILTSKQGSFDNSLFKEDMKRFKKIYSYVKNDIKEG